MDFRKKHETVYYNEVQLISRPTTAFLMKSGQRSPYICVITADDDISVIINLNHFLAGQSGFPQGTIS